MAGNNRSVVTPGGVFSSSSGAVTAGSIVGGTYVVSIGSSEDSNNVVLTVTNSSGVVQTINIPIGSDNGGGGTPGTGGDPVISAAISADNILTLTKESGAQVSVDLSQLNDAGTDTNDYLVSGTLDGTTLQLTVQNQPQVDVDLSSLLTEADVVTNGLTYTNTRNNVILTIQDNAVTLTSVVQPPINPSPPATPEPFNQIDGGQISFDAPNTPSGTDITNTMINSIDATDNQGNDVNITIPSPSDDGSFSFNAPAGTEEVEVDVTYTGTDSNDSEVIIEMDFEVPSYVPFYTLTTPPGTLTLTQTEVLAGNESTEGIMSGTSFTIMHDVIRRRWLAANQTGLTFMNAGFPVMSTEISDTVTIQNVTFYLYDFGFAAQGPLQATVI